MNTICSFRLCSLSDKELRKQIDKIVDKMYRTNRIPSRRIPANPNEDFDLLIGELLIRFKNQSEKELHKLQEENYRLKRIAKAWHELFNALYIKEHQEQLQ